MRWVASLYVVLAWCSVPLLSQAAAVAQSSEVVLVYENASEEEQGRYSFVYTVNDDPTIYACEANRCDTAHLSDMEMVTMTVHKLPEGFPRPQDIADQSRLEEFANSAEQTYRLENIATNLKDNGSGKPFFNVQLFADGSSVVDQATYDKVDPNTPVVDNEVNANTSSWVWAIVGGLSLVAILAGGGLFMIRRQSNQ